MIAPVRRLVLLGLCLALAACNAPRGAGFRNEVLAARTQSGAPVADFAVFAVNRASLPLLTAWPATGDAPTGWPTRVDQPSSLMIAPGDVLNISIWDAEANSLLIAPGQRVANLQDVQVGADGRIFLPFVGSLQVSGLSPDTARARIQDELLNTVPSAQVQVSVAPGRSNTATVVSGVRQPGVFPLADRNVSLLSLIGAGGGVIPELSNPQVRLFRGSQAYGIGLDRLFEDPALDTVVQGGDRIVVTADDRYFLSLGAAANEALHPFPKASVTALDAMSIVGGVAEARGNPQAILILREYPASAVRAVAPADGQTGPVFSSAGPPQERVVFTIDLTKADGLFSAGTFQIQPGDLVYVTESPLGAANTVVGLFGNLILASNRL
ncbi:polysaccharide export outer membrane protein [Loktanella fryxellensis]|uniref:Polysaccharide export outer membrane protein n=1 Tax=Loktanella fryxellensis TaxID=245187 RepID=A0A1H8GVJ1_9RHOB|nr:polysaccharide biosynthesis/export family protein [Loktanella fryxellensis]SEN47885.1 polysaccharide export outer membrane protein [Loktanella fryxellensis]